MAEQPSGKHPHHAKNADRFSRQIEARERQILQARNRKDRTLVFGLSAFGVVGWSIAAPTLLGVLLGMWLDRRWPRDFSWTLALMLAGVTLGCLSAWYWVSQEQRSMTKDDQQQKEESP